MKHSSFLQKLLFLSSLCLSTFALADIESSLKEIDKSIRLREYKQAVEQLAPLLKQNIAEAQYRMAGLYRSGTGVKKDMEKAMIEYRKASDNGLAEAQFALASLLEKRGSSQQKMIKIKKLYQAAAEQGHRKAIAKLASLEKKGEAGNIINISKENIFSAIRNNALDKIKTCIESGVDFNISDDKQRTPLMVALLSGHIEMSKLLLPVSTSQLDKPDINEDRPLHIATVNGFDELVSELIKKKVDINAVDSLGNTALLLATRHDDKSIIESLLNNNADYTIKNKKKQTAPMLAQTLDLKQARISFQKHNIKLPDPNKDYQKVDIKSFKSSIAKNSSLYKGWPLINIASLLGEKAIVAQLLDKGADLKATDNLGNTALHRAASKGQLETIELLISQGSNIDAINNKKQTALYIAASNGQLKVVDYLLKKGADSSIIADNETSALSKAITNGHTESAMILTKAKLDQPSTHQALLLAILNKMEDVSIELVKRDKLLIFPYDKNRSSLWHSANTGLIKVTEELLKHDNIDINLPGKNGYTALARAVNNGFVEISNLLIEHGANVNTLTNENNNLLMLAVLSGKKSIFEKLLIPEHINEKNKVGDTALMLAAGNGNADFVKLLIESGANIQTRNHDDLNAYEIALNSGYEDIANFIKESSGKLFKLFN